MTTSDASDQATSAFRWCERDRLTPSREAFAGFRSAFGRDPAHVAFAPGRVNLIGEHVDYSDGFVMPIAIGWGCAVAIGPGEPGRVRLAALDLDERFELDAGQPNEPGSPTSVGSWQGMVAGVFEHVRRDLADRDIAIPAGVDIALTCTVPSGGGLSSSAAIEMATATAVEQLAGATIDPKHKALLGQKAEHTYVGMPCGIMDQFISSLGREDHALMIDCRSLDTRAIPLPAAETAVVLAFASRVSHKLSDSEYPKRRAACEAAAEKLAPGRGIGALRDCTMEQVLAAGLDTDAGDGISLHDAAVHAVGENARVLAAADAFASGDLPTAGRLMNESHESLRDRYRVSCEEVDHLQGLAVAQPGVHGARITGGGFGGFCIALVDRDKAADVATAVRAGYQQSHGLDCDPVAMLAADGAGPMDGKL